VNTWELFDTPSGGVEPYLVNGPLIVANPKKKTERRTKHMAGIINMRRNRKGQFVARASNPKKKKKYHKKNYTGAGALVPMFAANPKKHKKRHSNPKTHHHKKARRNPPSIIPFLSRESIPSVGTITGVVSGLVAPPLLQGYVATKWPDTATQYPNAVKLGSYVLPPTVAFFIGGRKAVRDVLVGETATFIAQLVTPYIKTFLGLSGYTGAVPRGQFGLGRARAGHRAVAGNGGGYRQIAGYTGPVNRSNLMGYPNRTLRFGSRFAPAR
jgi:hypothetical protein